MMPVLSALHGMDWVFIVWYIVVALVVGLMYSRKGTKSLSDYFISGRSLPWWIAGTSMVATTFGVSTPLMVSELMWMGGIQMNWWWWTMILSNMVTIYFFARLWRRAHVLSDVELTELRFGGKAAAVLRGVKGGFFGLVMNCLIMGWELLAMGVLLSITFAWPKWVGMLVAFVLTTGYTVLAGFWGVVMTDMIQFAMGMVASVVLGMVSWKLVGGLAGLERGLESLGAAVGESQAWRLDMLPNFTSAAGMTLLAFIVFAAVKWWASWYPGSEPGGGGYVAQRMFASKDEKNSLLATLWFTFCHYVVRPWPWIMTAMAALVIYGTAATVSGDMAAVSQGAQEGYVRMILNHMPIGMKGLMLAALLGAFMSTVDTHLSWGASYLINDVYKRFIARKKSDRHYVRAAQWCVVGIAFIMLGVALLMKSITAANFLLTSLGAGAGLVYIMRWYWWRINAWSEITAMIAAPICYLSLHMATKFSSLAASIDASWLGFILNKSEDGTYALVYSGALLACTAMTTIAWVIVTYLTKPTDSKTLEAFYSKIKPNGPLWKPVARKLPDVQPKHDMGLSLVCTILACATTYGLLLGLGYVIFGKAPLGIGMMAGGAICGVITIKLTNRLKYEEPDASRE